MFLSFVKYISGYLRVQVTGYAPERFLNLCSGHDILLWKLIHLEDGYEFYISVRGFRQLKPFLKKTRTKVRILERRGLPFTMHRYRKRKVYFVGILLCMALLFFMSRYIWNIEITGNSNVTDDSLLHFLKEEHCGYGTLKSGIDCEKLEEKLRMTYTNVIWTSAQIDGTKLTIQIKENLVAKDAVDAPATEEPSDIVAAKDAVITEIVTRRGTPLVKAGDTVAAGDILVSGRLELYNDSAEITGYEYCVADADINGNVEEAYKDSFSMEYQKRVYSDRIYRRYALELFEKRLPVPWNYLPWMKISYPMYEKSTEYHQLCLCADFYLPVVWCIDTYREYELQNAHYTKKEAEELAKEHLTLYLQKNYEKKIQIIEKNVIIDINDNYCSSTGVIKKCESIGERRATEILSVETDERLATDELE